MSPEMIEKALLNRVDRFPWINIKDPQKLRELGDRNLPGLAIQPPRKIDLLRE